MAAENGDCSIPDFVCKSTCYGMVNEAPDSFELFTGLEFECSVNVINPRSSVVNEEDNREANLHVGGTIVLMDLDQNGIQDLILGDVGNNYLLATPLEESSEGLDSALFVVHDFPSTYSNTLPVNLPFFPAGYYLLPCGLLS